MSDGSSWIEIVLLAMLAAFIGLRLVSVLGKRTGHERPNPERAGGDAFVPLAPKALTQGLRASPKAVAPVVVPTGTDGTLAPALQSLVDADPDFNPERFVTGARAAYRLILEAFWSSDSRSLEGLVSDELLDNFTTAIGERDGARLANHIDAVDSVAITHAEMVGQMAEVTMRFKSRVTIAGAATTSVDVWTFSRHVGSNDPAWLLIATDDDTPGDGNLDA